MKACDALRSPHFVDRESFLEGRRTGLAIGALAASAVAFISLLGIEKAILALFWRPWPCVAQPHRPLLGDWRGSP